MTLAWNLLKSLPIVITGTTLIILGTSRASNAMRVTPPALFPSTKIDVFTGAGFASGAVSTGQEIFDFTAFSGDLITIDVDVTNVLPGTIFTDDDTQLFLFDSLGTLLAEDDDSGEGFTSLISNFLVSETDQFLVAVTTFNNDPILDSSGIVAGFEEDGLSSVEFDISITGVTPVPEPLTILGAGTALIFGGLLRRG
ncbi:MAG: PEP-CTERM sorting domain-containing protein [Cyanophyceae cyanobacterium]